MDDPRKSLEFRQLEQGDKIRLVLVGLFVLIAATTPPAAARSLPLAYAMVSVAALYAIFTRFVVDWHTVRAEGRVHLLAALLLCADVLWISTFIWALGPSGTGLSVLLLLPVVFASAFFPNREPALVMGIVCCCYIALGLTGSPRIEVWQITSGVAATLVLGWLTYSLAEVGRRERAVTANIVRHLTEGVFMVTETGRIAVVNPRAEHMFGIRASDILGLNIHDPANARALAPLEGILEDARASEAPREISIRDIHIENPNPLDVQCVTVPCLTETASVAAYIIVCRDITEALQDVRARQEGIAVLAHELKGRINALCATSEVLATAIDHLPASARDRALKILDSSTRRLAELAGRILDASALESGVAEFDFRPVSLVELAREVCAVFEPLAADKRITLTLDAPKTAPPVNGDATRLDQVFHNLIDNALRFTPEGGHVWVTVRAGEGAVSVAVADDGCGIPPERARVVFEKYAHGQGGSQAFVNGGIGLGLFICRQIVERHGGEIAVSSEEGRGTVFTFTLPAVSSGGIAGVWQAAASAASADHRAVCIASARAAAAS